MTAFEAARLSCSVETDAALAERLVALAGAYALVRAEGFDCTPDEIREAFLDAYGDELTPEQLDAVAGGLNVADYVMGGLAVVGGVAVVSLII